MKSQILKKCFSYIRKEVVLSVSVLLAVASCFFVAPDKEYLSYIDWNTLALLFSLMAVIKGLQEADFFVCMAGNMLKKIKTTRTMLFLLVFMPFVFSMVVTNDVSLITFVPFGIAILKMAQMERLIVPLVVLQTVAANLGSMLTPMGNPQNLYLYNQSGIGFGRFCLIMLPYVAASALFLAAAILFIKNSDFSGVPFTSGIKNRKSLLFYAGGFVLCLLAVFKVLPSVLVAVIVAISLLVLDRKILKKVDYALLGTFFAFFIFVGNFARIEPVRNFLFNTLRASEAAKMRSTDRTFGAFVAKPCPFPTPKTIQKKSDITTHIPARLLRTYRTPERNIFRLRTQQVRNAPATHCGKMAYASQKKAECQGKPTDW